MGAHPIPDLLSFRGAKVSHSTSQSKDPGIESILHDPSGASNGFTEKQRLELLALGQEKDPVVFRQAALVLADRLESAEQYEPAAKLYAMAGAQQRLEAILGTGSFGPRYEFLLKRFVKDATDPRVLLPMLAGSAVYGLTRSAALGRFAVATRTAWYSQGWGLRLAAATMGFVAEVPSYFAVAQGLQRLESNAKPGATPSLGENLATLTLTLGLFKCFAFAGNQGFLKLHGFDELGAAARLGGITKFTRIASSQGATFFGLLAAHQLEAGLKLRPRVDGETTVVDTLAAMLSLGVGARLGKGLLGERWAGFQNELEVKTQMLDRATQRPRLHSPILAPVWMAMGASGSGGSEKGIPSGELQASSPGPSWRAVKDLAAEARQNPEALSRLIATARDNPYALEHLVQMAKDRLSGATEGLGQLAEQHPAALVQLATLATKRHRPAKDLLLKIKIPDLSQVEKEDPRSRHDYQKALPLMIQAGHEQALGALVAGARRYPPFLDTLFEMAGTGYPGGLRGLWELTRERHSAALARLVTAYEILQRTSLPLPKDFQRTMREINELVLNDPAERRKALQGLAERAKTDSYAFTQLAIYGLEQGDKTANRYLRNLDPSKLLESYPTYAQKLEMLLLFSYLGNKMSERMLQKISISGLAPELQKQLPRLRELSELGPFEKLFAQRIVRELDIGIYREKFESGLQYPTDNPSLVPNIGDLKFIAEMGNKAALRYLRNLDILRVPNYHWHREFLVTLRDLGNPMAESALADARLMRRGEVENQQAILAGAKRKP